MTYRTTLADNVNTSIGCRFVLNGFGTPTPKKNRAGHQPPCYAGQRVQPHCWCDLLITVVDTEFDRTKRVLLVGYSWIGSCPGLSPECVSLCDLHRFEPLQEYMSKFESSLRACSMRTLP